MRTILHRPFASIYAVFLLVSAISTLRADFIQPVAVLASNGAAVQDALIDGSGFDDPAGSPDAIHSRFGSDMWSSVGSIKESVIFDLGKSVSLTRVYIWNYNVQDATDVGMKEVEVLVSSDSNLTNANFNAIARISLKEGGEAAQAFDVVGTNVRLVKLQGISNWGQGYTVGLAEVRFESGTITGNVPAIVLNSPHDGDEIAFGADVTIDAKVTDKDGAADLQKVEFFDGETLITNRTATPFTGILRGAAEGNHAVRVMATDKSGKTAWVTANVFIRKLVADSILKIDDTADQGTNINQIRYVGTWNLAQGENSDPRYLHNDHYESNNNKADYFLVRFKGVKIDIFATVASHHGTGMASIDGGPESVVNYKAANRGEQVYLWGSPILPNKEHTLKVRVVGDGVVTADRFDVSVSNKPEVTVATVKEVVATFTNVTVTLEDAAASLVDPTTINLQLDNTAVTPVVKRVPPVTTITYTPATPFAPGSAHALKVAAKDTTGAAIADEESFTLPSPPFPLTGMGEPAGTAGNWSLRQIWNGGRADALVSAVGIALQAAKPGFNGNFLDSSAPFLDFAKTANPGGGGYFFNNSPLPAEGNGLTDSDYVVVARARVKIPRTGDWTFGVHSDEGFGLRVIGAPFSSVSGAGEIDDNFPEYLVEKNNIADSNTRGVITNLVAGNYDLEFISWERVGAFSFEVYAAEGAFAEDADTDQWQ
ncbi:MAG TPA: Ig-like domain-containing protein, partial [Verrucomicrobiae bacterium]|nr:Ig-like domain-containing protein [Verrucomicrobiae bacterium]